jgi:hypothetical protein
MASQRGDYRSSCQGKVGHVSRKQCRAAKNAIRRARPMAVLIDYRCWWCGFRHVGTAIGDCHLRMVGCGLYVPGTGPATQQYYEGQHA